MFVYVNYKRGRMKITDLKLYHFPHRFLFLKIETDEGLVGWGEPVVEGMAATTAEAVNEWKPFLIGKNPLDIEYLWQMMYRGAFYRGGPVMMSAISGIDQALWDIKGKYHNVPIYDLLGGSVKTGIKVYRHVQGETAEELVKNTLQAKQEGYSLVKMSPLEPTHYVDSLKTVDKIVKKMAAVRDAVGVEMDLSIDFHGRIHKPMAKVISRELDQFNLAFIEEPVLPENTEALRDIAFHTPVPIALGERHFSRWDFKKVLMDGYVDIVQPDLSHAGGISECRRIATMAEAFDVAVAPHCPLSIVAFASCVQLDVCTGNSVFQEQAIDIHLGNKDNSHLSLLKDPGMYEFKDGFVKIPTKPGLGIEINEDILEEGNKNKHNWKNPLWRAYDGSPIEW